MRNITLSLLLAVLLGLGLNAAPAHAQSARTFVSSSGNDVNDCNRFAPCRTFQTAHDKTFPDGEITVLDPGGYGALTITKSISVVNDGVGEAGVLVPGGATGITINAGPAAYVNLRGITIQGIGFGGGTGLRFNTGFALTMTNSVVRNHTGNGIDFRPTGNSNLSLSNTLAADNGGSGLFVQPSGSGVVKLALTRLETYNNSANGVSIDGTLTTGTVDATASDSVAAGNSQVGFLTSSDLSHTFINFMIVRAAAANNGVGIRNAGHATLRVGQSVVTGNVISWQGCVGSYGDNYVDSNGDGSPPAGCSNARK